jgi:hypothetical protein
VHIGLQAPQPFKWPLSRIPQPPLPSAGVSPGPTDIEPRRLDFRFRAPNRPPLRISGSRPPRPATGPSPHIPQPPATVSWGLPRSHRYRAQGARFSVSRAKPAPPCASRAPGPPGPQLAPLPHPTTPCYR